jgi:dipeptidyl-peptidase-4
MINSLIEANKQFDMFIVPDRTHGIYKGKNTRLNLYTKMTNFVEEHLINKSTEIKG